MQRKCRRLNLQNEKRHSDPKWSLDEIRCSAQKSRHCHVLKNLSWRLENYHREISCRTSEKTTLVGNQGLIEHCFNSVSRNLFRGARFAFLNHSAKQHHNAKQGDEQWLP